MAETKVIENIKDLKFKLGEKYNSKHITIKNDNMYISKEFALYLIHEPLKEHKRYRSNLYRTKYNVEYQGASITIVIMESKFSEDIRYLIAGSCGSYGFNGMQFTSAERMGVRTKRVVNKYLVNLFLSSPILRLEKIRVLMNVKK